ncbi:MAG TPA: ABC transporter permease [Vicinamibacterales bacterium]|nr:ABC transporter permease [Vicinamibacterales bacterium]
MHMRTVLQDLRYGLRTLTRSPGFALVAIATLALGIGANTAIFSAVNAVLLRPLPYARPHELVMVWQDMRARGGPAQEWATPGNVADWKASGIFSGLTAVQGWQATITGNGDPEPLVGEQVTFDYFDVLGVPPAIGRTFRADEDVPNAARVVVISDGLWQRRFGGRPDAVGASITIGGEAHEIIGVMPRTFRPGVIASAELWRPRRLDLAKPSRGAVVLRVIARLPPGATIEQTSASTSLLATQLAAAYPEWNTGMGISLASLHAQVVGEAREGLLIVLGAVGFVLLMACANIANLLLARATARSREIAVRLALGAGRGRLIRQLLTESLLLSAIGGVAGIFLGSWGIDALVAIAPSGAPRLDEIGIDGTVLLFATTLAVLTGVLFGLVPALQASRAEVSPSLRDGGRGASASSGYHTRRALIVLEVASAVVLLVAGGLLLRTFATLQASDLGFTPDRVLVGAVNPPRVTYSTREQQIAFYDRLLERAASLPGVETAALSSVVPLGGDSDMSVLVEGKPIPRTDAETDAVWYRLISSEYFRAMQIPLKRGRTFEAREAAPAIVVSEATARRFWKDQDPIGRRVRFSSGDQAPWFTVVGVVGEVRMRGPRGESRSEVYLPYWQFPELGTNVILKTSGRPDALTAPLRRAVREIDPDIPVASIQPMTSIVGDSIEQPRFLALLVGVFAGAALALAAVGIYGLIAFSVAQRTQEIGVRMALGAARADVLRLVVFDGMKLTAIGVAIGAGGAAAVGASLQSQLFGVTPLDPLTFGATGAALVCTALVACFIPAARAARVDPMVALRTE